MALYLLDTNIASDILRARSPQANRRTAHTAPEVLAISVMTEAELLYGLARVPEARTLHELVQDFLSRISIQPWGSAAARHSARLRWSVERIGRPVAAIDLQIAAHALALNAVLVTRDQAFRDIPGLVCEDWTRD